MPDRVTCPICQTRVSADTQECPVCGARLTSQSDGGESASGAATVTPQTGGPRFDPALGEDDLYLPRLLRFSWWGVAAPVALAVIALIALGFVSGTLVGRSGESVPSDAQGVRTAVPTLAFNGGAVGSPASTPSPTLFLPTLTLPPPPTDTPTPTETPGPCEQIVQAGDTLITLAIRCGHQDLDVLDAIVDLNGLRSAESIQQGQHILIPWPTPTPGGPVEGEGDGTAESAAPADTPDGTSDPYAISEVIPTATLQPGVGWYTVQPGDNILKIAIEYDATIEILSQLNPEVTFSQCDFGMDSGGGNCIVQLVAGQQLRVPVPTPIPTSSPTPSGSETPTPTATPTFNAPSLLNPGDRTLFGRDDMVTLRWVTTGILGEGEVYQVTVTDTTAGMVHTETTSDTLFILPAEWQPVDGQRHTFTWQVAVGPADNGGGLASITFSTLSRLFFWDSR
jgi:LysM repeat protein